jgi:ubiquinone/menaquinone biosynthesis C-methylase UbiE
MYEDETRALEHYARRARLYDWANRFAALLRGTSGEVERRKAIDRLRLTAGARILEVCSGTGTNLVLMSEAMPGQLRLMGIDISRQMLQRSRLKCSQRSVPAIHVEGEASRLPFRDGCFDAVFHHGGFAEFGDKPRAMEEMLRVARPGGRIVVCDVGVPTDRPISFVNRMLMKTQPVYQQPPPVDLVPPDVIDQQLTWIGGGAWYLIDFTKPLLDAG